MKNKGVKPCPFCGENPTLNKGMHGCNVDTNLENCFQCECGIETPCFETEAELIDFWNTRKKK